MERELNELVEKLKSAVDANLQTVVLYGSAASGEFHKKHSDLNILCVVQKLDAVELARLNPATTWWVRKGHPTPLVFTLESLRRAADVFAIELLDIKASHRTLHGEDVFAALEVPMVFHRMEVERELGANLVRLRQGYLSVPLKLNRLVALMTASVSTFAVLFRHALLALGEEMPTSRRRAVDRMTTLLGFDGRAFHAVLDIREGKRRVKDVEAEALFGEYLEGVSRVVDEVDRRLAARS